MQYRNMGKWGLKLSEISIGSWMTDLNGLGAAETARQSIRAAYDAGVNFFDCADAYSGGEARDYKRSSYVVSSKVFFPTGRGANDWGLSRKHIVEQLDTSLKNMKLDYLDLYFCHRFDPTTPIEETMQTLSDMVERGKILYYGVSEWSPVQLTKAIACIKEMHLRPISVIQPQYNMVDRYIEDEIVQICTENGIGIVPFSPLAQGLLTGKYRKGQPLPAGSRATHQADKQINALLTDENLDKVDKLALAWILRLPQISSVITGASKPEQLETNIAASGLRLPPDVLDEIEKILDYKPFVRKIG